MRWRQRRVRRSGNSTVMGPPRRRRCAAHHRRFCHANESHSRPRNLGPDDMRTLTTMDLHVFRGRSRVNRPGTAEPGRHHPSRNKKASSGHGISPGIRPVLPPGAMPAPSERPWLHGLERHSQGHLRRLRHARPGTRALVSSLDETQPFAPAVGDQLLVELALVEVTYDFIASRSYCIRCGSPLGVNLRVEVQPTQGGDTWSHVRVSSRCRSWRRHLHTALVARPPMVWSWGSSTYSPRRPVVVGARLATGGMALCRTQPTASDGRPSARGEPVSLRGVLTGASGDGPRQAWNTE